MSSLRGLLLVAAAKNCSTDQLDIMNALLHGDLDKNIYTALPPGYTPSSNILAKFPSQVLV